MRHEAVERAGVNLHTLQPSALGVTLKLLLDIASICNLDNVNMHVAWTFLWRTTTGADLGGGYRGCAPLPEMTYGFLIQLVFCEKSGLLLLVTPFLSGAPLLKKILDPPLNNTCKTV